MALNAQITLSLVAQESSSGDLSSTLRVTPAAYAKTLTDGSGTDKAQVAWGDARTLAGASETLSPASLTDMRAGATATVTMTAIKAVYVRNTGTGSLSFAGGPFAAAGQTVSAGAVTVAVEPSSGMAATGITVTGAIGRSYEILLIGEGSVA